MKRTAIYLLIAYTFAGITAVSSQNNGNGNNNGNTGKSDKRSSFVEVHIDKLKQDITLTADQEKEIRKLLDKLYKNREQAAKKTEESQRVNDKKFGYDTYIASLYEILTEEQCAILDEKNEKRKIE